MSLILYKVELYKQKIKKKNNGKMLCLAKQFQKRKKIEKCVV